MKALRQGDVLIRSTTEQIEAELGATDWPLFRSLWTARLKHLHTKKPANRAAVSAAVSALYSALERPLPHLHWHDGTPLEREEAGVPLRAVTDTILHALWYSVPNIDRLVAQMGYDPHSGQFRITSNKALLTSDFRMRGRVGSRPPWTHDLGNMISQFDMPAIVLYEYAVASGISVHPNVARIAEAVKQLLDETFAAVLFETACVVLDRPLTVSLDVTNLLSATSIDPRTMTARTNATPAYESRTGHIIFAVNGVVLPPQFFNHNTRQHTEISWRTLSHIQSPRARSAMINYIGWERFVELTPRSARTVLNKSSYGELMMIECNFQHITVVRVTNSTAEPDGTFRNYVIPVDADCRPLPNPADPAGEMGAPQRRTALNAVASTFGLTGEEYHQSLQAES